MVQDTIGRELVRVVLARMQQAYRDAAHTVDAAGPVSIHPDALGPAVDADLAEQPRGQPIWAAGSSEAGPHIFTTRSFLDNAAASLRSVLC